MNSLRTEERTGRFGMFGGQYVPETLMNALMELEIEYKRCLEDPEFWAEYHYHLKEYSGRPTPLYYAANLTRARRRQDLSQTGRSQPHRRPQDQ